MGLKPECTQFLLQRPTCSEPGGPEGSLSAGKMKLCASRKRRAGASGAPCQRQPWAPGPVLKVLCCAPASPRPTTQRAAPSLSPFTNPCSFQVQVQLPSLRHKGAPALALDPLLLLTAQPRPQSSGCCCAPSRSLSTPTPATSVQPPAASPEGPEMAHAPPPKVPHAHTAEAQGPSPPTKGTQVC